MNTYLLLGGLLAGLLGLAHSLLGERLLLGPLFRRDELPRLLGSTVFARRTLRFAWHLTTVLLVGIGVVAVALSQAPLQPQTAWVFRVLSLTFAACAIVSLTGSRGKHFSWFVFLVIAATFWFGVS